MDQPSPLPERRVSHYLIAGSLGAGGMGEVYAAFDETLKRRVAMKAIRADQRWSPEAKARFVREARLLSQLDHPNVCRVYDYIEEGDAHWLVLELIDGSNLRDLIARGLSAPHKMSIAEQIAAVLVATHAAGVVHRDLKPANVMMTPAGDVKVLDFGLAQSVSGLSAATPTRLDMPWSLQNSHATDIDATRSAAPRSVSDNRHNENPGESLFRTEAGAVSGTVAYMSPEQAMGSPATAASDMYSFGILLQELFTGRRPYDATLDVAEMLERVQRAETRPVEGVAADLATLITRLTALAPTQRPTAVEALERLHWIGDKPARRLRRLAVAAVLTALALAGAKYVLDLARERAVAVAARADADQRRAQAETLIGFMLGDLQTKLRQVGRLDLLEDVGRAATSYFKAVPAESLTDEELYRRSQAMYQIGQVYQAKGNLTAAIDAYRDSLALITQVTARTPDNSDWQLGLGTAHFYVGDALRRQGDLDGALAHFLSYWEIAERLLARDPENKVWKLEVSFGHANVAGILEAKGDLRRALAELETSLELKQQVSSSAPDNVEWKRTLASTHNRLGVVLHKLGQLERARDNFRRDLDISRSLLETSSGNAQLLKRVAIAHSWLGAVLDDLGNVTEAMSHYQALFAITSQLVARDPANAAWQREHAAARMKLGEGDIHVGTFNLAEAKYDQSIVAFTALLQKNPTNVSLRRDLGRAHVRRARLLLAWRRPELALREAERCRSVLAPSLAKNALDNEALPHAIECDLLLGSALKAVGRPTEASAAWVRALNAVEPIARASDDPAYLQLWARALRHVGRDAESAAVAEQLIARGYRNRWFLEAIGRAGA